MQIGQPLRPGCAADRYLDWDGRLNVRDLGGLRAGGGRQTCCGAIVRARLPGTPVGEGWQRDGFGPRQDGRRSDATRPSGWRMRPRARTASLPSRYALDGAEDRSFWKGIEQTPEAGTPLYYRAHLMPGRPLGGGAGGDRPRRAGRSGLPLRRRARPPGQIAMLALTLAGVSPEVIGADYEMSHERLAAAVRRARDGRRGRPSSAVPRRPRHKRLRGHRDDTLRARHRGTDGAPGLTDGDLAARAGACSSLSSRPSRS